MQSASKVISLVDKLNGKALDDFSLFWENYPRKKAKGDAMKAWKQTEEVRPPIEAILGAINRQEQSNQWQDKDFVPYPGTWLRRWSWDDED